VLRQQIAERSTRDGVACTAGLAPGDRVGEQARRHGCRDTPYRHLLKLPEGFDTAAFMAERLLPEAKVAFVPVPTFYPFTSSNSMPE
jgi:hypothetical protein